MGAYLDAVTDFCPERFGLGRREAELMDPVHRQFLSVAALALTDAGLDLPMVKGRSIGVYAGYCSGSDDLSYLRLVEHHAPQLLPLAFTGNLPPLIAGRVSHCFDLRGPSVVVDTACSSSLVAVHQACVALRAGDCEMAIVGGVKLHLFPVLSADRIGIESTDGITRPFAGGDGGTGIGEGVGAVVLKPLFRALKDGDQVHAVIAGSACNQDGMTAGLTVPNVVAQQQLLELAWQRAGISPYDIGCIEAHGTGTRLGDPIEFEALQRAFQSAIDLPKMACALGSVKAILGHLDSAAGISGFIKAVLMVRNGYLLPTPGFVRPNQRIDYFASPFYVNDRIRPWPQDGGEYCGVSAFSMNGTNCHVVLRAHHGTARRNSLASPAPDTLSHHWFTELPRMFSASEDAAKAETLSADAWAVLRRAWCDTLGGSEPAEDSDFFACGGDSLRAAVLASRLSRELDRPVLLTQIWATPTFGALGLHLSSTATGDIEALPSFDLQETYPPSAAQRQIYLHSALRGDLLYNMPFGVSLTGALDTARLELAVQRVCDGDPGLSLRFQMRGGELVLVPAQGARVELRCVDGSAGEAAASFIRPFDLAAGPLVRMLLVKEKAESHLMLLDFHHAVMDGVSVAIFMDRVLRSYRDAEGTAPVQPPTRTALDLSLWHAQRTAGGKYSVHENFWEEHFRNRRSALVQKLVPSAQVASSQGQRHTVSLEIDLSEQIRKTAQAKACGLHAFLLGAYALALSIQFEANAFNVGTPFSGRNKPGTEDVLGMLVNMMPIPLDIDPDIALDAWLSNHRRFTTACMEYQDGPADMATKCAQRAGGDASFNVAFALQNMDLTEFVFDASLHGRPLPFYELPWNVAKFALTLFAMEVSGGLVLSFEYREGSVTEPEARSFEHHVVHALRLMVSGHRRLGDILSTLTGASSARKTIRTVQLSL
jgi:3-oxoacyl-(acyl-carrier-protein) synthase